MNIRAEGDAREELRRRFRVSRETMAALDRHLELLAKWTARINLVSRDSLRQAWSRHFLDSAQILPLVSRQGGLWADIGSGGGFPGLVLAILSHESAPGRRFLLIESDRRKAAFLRAVVAELSLRADVVVSRAEALPPLGASVLSARALAPLEVLLSHAERHLAPGGAAVFPKGAEAGREIEEALEKWRFRVQKHQSVTRRDAVILKITEIERA